MNTSPKLSTVVEISALTSPRVRDETKKRTSEDENIKYLTNSFERLNGMLESVTSYLFELPLILDQVRLGSYAALISTM